MGVVIVKIVYVGAVFYAYSVSKSLPTAVFLLAVKARWAGLVVSLATSSHIVLSLQFCCWVRAVAETFYIREEIDKNCGEYMYLH